MFGALLAFLTSNLLELSSPSPLGKVSIDDLEQALVVPLGQMNEECRKQADFCYSSTNRCPSCPKGLEAASMRNVELLERTDVLAGSCEWQSE